MPNMFGKPQNPPLPARPKLFSQPPVRGFQRPGYYEGDDTRLADAITPGDMIRPEDPMDYGGIETFDRMTDYFNQPNDVQENLMNIYSQSLDRIRAEEAAGMDPYRSNATIIRKPKRMFR